MELAKLSDIHSIYAYEELAKTQPQVEIAVKEVVHGGIYAREILIPKGTALTGGLYLNDHLEIMVYGDVTVVDEFGIATHYTGYNLIQSDSGKKRAGIAHEDTLWVTFNLHTPLRSIVAPSLEDLIKEQAVVSRADYKQMCVDLDIDEDTIREQSEITEDMINDTMFGVTKAESPIEGYGMFSDRDMFEDTVVGWSRISGMRTLLGRYVNHSAYPNAVMALDSGDVYLLSTKPIRQGDEITVDYRQVREARIEEGDL